MRWKEYPIADCVGRCQTWNPNSSGAGSFDYIDLSSVDKGTKSIASTERYECSDAPSRARQLVETDDVLVATVRPNLNGVALVNGAHHGMTASTGYCVLRPDKDELDSRFLFHWVKTDVFVRRMVDVATGANYPAVSDAKVKASKIPLPPLAEQKRIAGILDAADALRAKRREALAQLDTLIQSTFIDMFGDPVTNSNIPSAIMTELVTKFIDYRGKSPAKSKGGVPLITAKIVKEKEVKEPNEFIPANSYDAWMRRGIPNPGDVVITTEAPMGEVALVPDYKAAFAQRLLVLQPDETKVKSIYLMWALTMPFVIRQLRQRSTGSTVTGIRSREFKKVNLPIPSLNLQRRFAAIVESVEHQKVSQRAHLAELDNLFASLQSRAFRGDL